MGSQSDISLKCHLHELTLIDKETKLISSHGSHWITDMASLDTNLTWSPHLN